ncbi:unnamed protein product [Pedinophyceae sp. YPF-701]|nr:unnamed protein product [Pedinophyceae sp. YPF-701]
MGARTPRRSRMPRAVGALALLGVVALAVVAVWPGDFGYDDEYGYGQVSWMGAAGGLISRHGGRGRPQERRGQVSASRAATVDSGIPFEVASNIDFGDATAISADGGTFAMGAPLATIERQARVGIAFVFQVPSTPGANATLIQTFLPEVVAPNTYFGEAVALDGSGQSLVLGATHARGTGTVEVYSRDAAGGTVAYTRIQTVRPNVAELGVDNIPIRFGHTVALTVDGRTLVVGAPQFGLDDEGALYVFSRPDVVGAFGLSERLAPKIPAGWRCDNCRLGESLGVSNNGGAVVAGAPGYVLNQQYDGQNRRIAGIDSAGGVFFFERVSGGRRYEARDPAALETPLINGKFGTAVAISGDGLAVVATADSAGSTGATLYHMNAQPQNGWPTLPVAVPSFPLNITIDSVSLALSGTGNVLAAGSSRGIPNVPPSQTALAFDIGAVLFFEGNGAVGTYERTSTIVDVTGNLEIGQSFGKTVALSRDASSVSIGAPAARSSFNGKGFVYRTGLSQQVATDARASTDVIEGVGANSPPSAGTSARLGWAAALGAALVLAALQW